MTKAEMNLRARGLAPRVAETEVAAKPAKSPKVIDTVKADAAEKPAAKKAAAPKAAAAKTETKAAPAKKAPAKKADKAGDEA